MTLGNAWLPPTSLVKSELIAILENDSGLHGEIWRSTVAGLTDEEIQKARGASYPNFIWNYRDTWWRGIDLGQCGAGLRSSWRI